MYKLSMGLNVRHEGNMIGSEKQVKWATEIAAQWINGLKRQLDYAKDRVARNNMPAVWAEIVEAQVTKTLVKIEQMTAAQIIDNRTIRVVDAVMDACGKTYEARKAA